MAASGYAAPTVAAVTTGSTAKLLLPRALEASARSAWACAAQVAAGQRVKSARAHRRASSHLRVRSGTAGLGVGFAALVLRASRRRRCADGAQARRLGAVVRHASDGDEFTGIGDDFGEFVGDGEDARGNEGDPDDGASSAKWDAERYDLEEPNEDDDDDDDIWGDFRNPSSPSGGGGSLKGEDAAERAAMSANQNPFEELQGDNPMAELNGDAADFPSSSTGRARGSSVFGDDEDDDGWDAADDFDDDAVGFRYEDTLGKQNVFAGLDGPEDEDDSDPNELSLLYDDFQLDTPISSAIAQDLPKTFAMKQDQEGGLEDAMDNKLENVDTRRLRKMSNKVVEEREYIVQAEGIAIRTLPDEMSPKTGEILRQGETFKAIEAVDGPENDARLYLRLENGRGWVFDDEAIFPGMPSVKLVSVSGTPVVEEEPTIVRPVISILGRPNVGKTTLTNRICDLPDPAGGIVWDQAGVTRDRVYKEAEYTVRDWKHRDASQNQTYLFEVVDTGGLIMYDDPYELEFKEEMRYQIDVALRESVAAIMVVDSWVGVTDDDIKIAKYLRENYVSRGLKVVLAVTKCDNFHTMDLVVHEFWKLGLGEPIPCSGYHGRGVDDVLEAVIDGGCDGLYPTRARKEWAAPTLRNQAIDIAIVGKPNAGKSSLLNALCGEERSIVTDLPGATTDCVDAYVQTDSGNLYRFIDTAGVRKTKKIRDGSEWLAVSRAMKAVQRADVALLCIDASELRKGNPMLGSGGYWVPQAQERLIARRIEERGTGAIVVLTKWDAVLDKNQKTMTRFVEAVRANLAGVGQWAEIVTVSAKTGQHLGKLVEAIDKTVTNHRRRIKTPVLNEVLRDTLLWKLPASKGYNSKQGRIYYACQDHSEPPSFMLFVNNPRLFNEGYRTYLENKLRQDLSLFGTPIQIQYKKRTEQRALKEAEQWLSPRLAPDLTLESEGRDLR